MEINVISLIYVFDGNIYIHKYTGVLINKGGLKCDNNRNCVTVCINCQTVVELYRWLICIFIVHSTRIRTRGWSNNMFASTVFAAI